MHLTAVLRSMPDPQDAISGEAANGLDRRLSARRSLRLEAHSRSNSSGDIRVLVRDVSPGGLMFETESAALSVNDYVEVCLPGSQTTKGRVVWTSGRVFGCEFNEAVSAAAISAALLKAEPQDGEILPSALANASHIISGRQLYLGPELNFAQASALAIGLWAMIGAMYFLVR